MTPTVPQLTVYDRASPCPYLEGQVARMPLRWPTRKLRGDELDSCLAVGDRRSGAFLYRVCCPQCQACEAVRIDVHGFRPDSTQRRIKRKGDRLLQVRVGPPVVDSVRVRLFNEHRNQRGLNAREADIDKDGYVDFLAETCCETLEISYRVEEHLVAVALADRGAHSLSAVYCYFDPAFARLSPGTYSVLKQIDLCREIGLRYLYLGYYIAESPRMRYKARFRPQERLVQGKWLLFAQ